MSGVDGSSLLTTAERLAVANQQKGDWNAATFYDDWSTQYDQDVLSPKVNYKQAFYVADELLKLKGQEKDVSILDCGAGTGLSGVELGKRGFTNVDGLDPSPKMLKIAERRGCYQRTIVSLVTAEGTQGIEDNKYDVLTLCGAFGQNHMKPDCLLELRRMTKPNGYIVIGMNAHESVMKWVRLLEAAIEEYEQEGKFKLHSCTNYPDFKVGWPGFVYVLQVLKK